MTALVGTYVARDPGGNGTTPRGARLAQAGVLYKNADGTVRVGVLADGLGPVVSGASGMSYKVRKHVAVTKASEANGPVLVPNDGEVTVTTDPAPGSNSRIDVVYVSQRLVTGDGGAETTNAPVIDVAKGVAAASPSVPSIPAGALELARVPVTAGTTATSGLTFTQGQWTTTLGGTLPLADGKGDTDWVAPTLTNGWANFGDVRATAGYCRKGGVVYLKGMVKDGATGVMFNLPAGFRPAATDRWDVPANAGTASVEIGPAGDVVLVIYKAGAAGAVSLAPIRFVAEV